MARALHLHGHDRSSPSQGLSEEERTRHKGEGELVYPNLGPSLSADHVATFRLWPQGADRTRIDRDFLFHPDEIVRRSFEPRDAVGF